MTNTNDIVQLTGKEMFARVQQDSPRIQTNPNFKDRWEVELLLDTANRAKAETIGIKLRDDSQRTSKPHDEFVSSNDLESLGYNGVYAEFYKNTTLPVWETNKAGKKVEVDTTPAKPVIVRDSNGNDIPVDKVPIIGNGSDITVNFSPLTNSTKKKGEWGARIISITIHNLVEYTPDTGAPAGTFVFDPSEATVDPSVGAEKTADDELKAQKKDKKVVKKADAKVADDLEDEIPF